MAVVESSCCCTSTLSHPRCTPSTPPPQVPCVAVVENMSFFDADGKRHFPFGHGSGERIQREFGLPHLIRFPIEPALSAAGDGGRPLVVSSPASATAASFGELGAAVVREVAKLRQASKSRVR